MRLLREFEEYREEGVVRRCAPDPQRAKSMIKQSERKLRSLQQNISAMGINAENANDYVEYCYDTIMMIIRAKLYSDGYATTGQGAHEAEVAYTRVLGITDKDVRFLNQLRQFRNGILYYGKEVDAEYAENVIAFTTHIHPLLRAQCGPS